MRIAVEQEQQFPRPPSPPPLAAKSEIPDFGRNIKVTVKSLTSKKPVQSSTTTETTISASVPHVTEKLSTATEKKVNSTNKAPKKSSDLSKAISSLGLGITVKSSKKPAGISGVIPAKNVLDIEKAHETSDVANTLRGLKSELQRPKVSSLPPNSLAAFEESERRANDQPLPPPPGLSINQEAGTRIGTWVRIGGASQTLAASKAASGPAVKLSASEYPSLSGR
jgi:ribosomal protein S20